MTIHKFIARLLPLAWCVCGAFSVFAQTTAFSYQGRLNDNNIAATGLYDLQFKLFDALAGGNQLEMTLTRDDVQVTNGVFTVMLDFTEKPFTGVDVWLEIAVRPGASNGAYTTLAPRQKFTATPYAVRSLLSTTAEGLSCLGCVTGGQIGSLPTGNANYIQNTNAPQASSNFNISGNGTAGGTLSANIVNAATQYNLNGNRILSNAGISNLFVGASTGAANTTGKENAFFGQLAGLENTTGSANAFFGDSAGRFNSTGEKNTFTGSGAGLFNTTGSQNAFFGTDAGRVNTTGFLNAFFGENAGRGNTTGNTNAFFGNAAGKANTTASQNAFFGWSAGEVNTTGDHNSFFGALAGSSNTMGANNSFFGAATGAGNTTANDNSFFGYFAGLTTNIGTLNAFFGRSAGQFNTTGSQNVFLGGYAGQANTQGSGNTALGAAAGNSIITGSNNTLIGKGTDVSTGALTYATAIGSDAVVTASNTIVLGRSGGEDTVVTPGRVIVGMLGAAGATALCRNASNQISTCSSSRRYKDNIQNFSAGLKLVNQLRPVTFDWKADRRRDVGFVAEEVAALDPLLATYNDHGAIEGVKYAQLTTVLVNAVKEQQALIETQRKELAALKQAVCAMRPRTKACPPHLHRR